jgi:hypothetical protein
MANSSAASNSVNKSSGPVTDEILAVGQAIRFLRQQGGG